LGIPGVYDDGPALDPEEENERTYREEVHRQIAKDEISMPERA
jgi:hypothetical protein